MVKSWRPFVFTLFAAVLLRWLFYTGISSETDLIQIGRVSQSIIALKGNSPSIGEALQQVLINLGGIRNLIFSTPNLLSFYFLGISQFSSIFPSILQSLLSLYLIYSITKLITKRDAAAQLAALFWAFFPLDVFFATTAPRVEMVTCLALLGILGFLIANDRGRMWRYGLVLVLLLAIFLLDPWVLLVPGIFISYVFLSKDLQNRMIVLPLVIFIGITLLVAGMELGAAFLDFYNLLLGLSESVLLLPLIFVAATVCILDQPRKKMPYLLLTGATLVSFIAKTIFQGPSAENSLFSAGVFILLFFAFVSMLLGDYFSSHLDPLKVTPWTITLAFLGIGGAILAVIGQNKFLPPLQNFDWVGLHSLFLMYSILTGVAFAGIIASPYLITGVDARWKIKARFILLALILIAFLPYLWNRKNDYGYLTTASAEALAYLSGQNVSLPIYIVNEETYRRIDLLSNMDVIREQLEKNEETIDLITIDAASQIQEGYVLAFENEIESPPETWWRMGSFGPLGKPRVVAYRILTVEYASQYLFLEETSVDKWGQNNNWQEVYGSLVNMGLFCKGYMVWEEAMLSNPHAMDVVPYNTSSECFTRYDNLVSLDNLRDPYNTQGYITFPSSSVEGTDSLNITQISLPIYDMRTVSVDVLLQPNTMYAYSIELKSPSPTATLYWNVAGYENYLEMKIYPEWTRVSVLMLTPSWDEPKYVSLSPVLFDHLDVVSVRDFFIGPVGWLK